MLCVETGATGILFLTKLGKLTDCKINYRDGCLSTSFTRVAYTRACFSCLMHFLAYSLRKNQNGHKNRGAVDTRALIEGESDVFTLER